MAQAITGGLLKKGHPAERLTAIDPCDNAKSTFQARHIIAVDDKWSEKHLATDVIVLAVKPQTMQSALTPLLSLPPQNAVFISIAAGLSVKKLIKLLPTKDSKIIRCMPNTPAMIGEGISALFADSTVSRQHREITQEVMSAVGETFWVESEREIDLVTAVSGSGPAYFFLLIEALTEAGTERGLSPETAASLALQTAAGACSLARSSLQSPSELRKKVTSPAGTTERAVEVLEQGGLRDLVSRAVNAAYCRSVEISKGK